MVDRRSGVCTESVRSLRLWVAVQTTGPETSRLDEIQGGSRTAKLAEKDTFVQQELIPSTLQPVWASHAKPATRVDWSGYGMIVSPLLSTRWEKKMCSSPALTALQCAPFSMTSPGIGVNPCSMGNIRIRRLVGAYVPGSSRRNRSLAVRRPKPLS